MVNYQTIDNRSKEIKTIDNRLIDRTHSTIKHKLGDESYDRRYTKKILTCGFSQADIMNVVEYCEKNATQHKGKAFVKIFQNKMKGIA